MNAAHIPRRELVTETGSVTISFDPEAQIVHLKRIGYHGRKDMERHFDALGQVLGALRSAGVPIRMLVDMREASLHDADATDTMDADSLSQRAGTIHRPNDRVALLVTSSLAKMQMRRIATTTNVAAQVGCFMSADAATLWLTAGS